jgi:hypothetical protein
VPAGLVGLTDLAEPVKPSSAAPRDTQPIPPWREASGCRGRVKPALTTQPVGVVRPATATERTYASAMLKVTEMRAAFAAERAPALAAAIGVHAPPRPPSPRWTTRGVWFETADVLTAVFGPQEERHVDLALAHGLRLAGGRALQLVLPRSWSFATVQRVPWLNAQVDVHVYDEPTFEVAAAPLSSLEQTTQAAGGVEASPELHLGAAGEHVRPLLEWASLHPLLAEAHRRDVRAWTCRGQRVLRVTRTGLAVQVLAGIDAAREGLKPLSFDGPIEPAALSALKEAVQQGIKHAEAQTYGAFREHHLQEILRRAPHQLGLEAPVLREVPAWRPAGGPGVLGRGFLDLVGKDGLGDVVLVETKLAADDMLVLQGLDYWIWATAPANRTWLNERLHADPGKAELRLLYAVGSKDGGPPKLSSYAKAHLAALADHVDWRLALIESWAERNPVVELLPPRTQP